jgi:hypothetical protein
LLGEGEGEGEGEADGDGDVEADGDDEDAARAEGLACADAVPRAGLDPFPGTGAVGVSFASAAR